MDLQRVISEIQRRHVGRVAGVYAVVGWVIIQVVATVFPLLEVSNDAQRWVVIAVIAAFPIVVALAWAFDITPQGIQRTEAFDPAAPLPARDANSRKKNVAFFGIGILVALVAFAAMSRYRGHFESAVGVHSIAVLPFDDMSEKQDQRYFTDGISEEILNRLAQIENLRVPARTSSFAFRAASLGIGDIGQKLNVDAVLEGSVRRDGNNVRVTARLIDTKTGKPLWSQEYQKQISSIFAIQDEIATDIVGALRLKLDPTPVKARNAVADIKATPEAVDAYMKGLDLLNRRTDSSLRKALEYFTEATKKDQQFALGFAMLAQTYALLPAYGDFSAFDASAKGQQAAAHALELNPSLAEAYAALGQIRQNFEWDFTSAERSYKRAILFNAGYATAHQWRAEALLLLGNAAESQAEIETALDLDPASTAALYVKAYQHVTRHEFAPANRILDRIVASNPDFTLALIAKASVAVLNGAPNAGGAVAQLASNLPVLAEAVTAASKAAVTPTERPAAAAAIAKLNGRRAASEVALWYAVAGLQDDALATIKKAYESGSDANLPLTLLHPAFDGIRSKKEFQAILSELQMTSE